LINGKIYLPQLSRKAGFQSLVSGIIGAAILHIVLYYSAFVMINPTQLILPCQIFVVYYNRGTVVKARRLQFQFPMVSMEFFIDIIILAAVWAWDQLSL
jgi:hypothetical protein